MSTKPLTVAIIGGGLAAPTLALSLLNHAPHFTPTIYEFRPSGAASEGNVALAPNALRVLDYVGIYTRIAAQGHNYEDLYCLNGRWQVLGQIWNGSEREYNYKALRINRSIVRGALLDECAKRGVEIRYGMKCVGVESETDSGATVKFDNGETVTADFVVGADGIHSHIREFVEKDSEPIFTGIMSIGGVVDRSTLPPAINDVPLPGFVFAQAGAFALMPTDFKRQKIGFFMQMPQADRSRDEWTKTANDKEELSRMLKKYCEKGWPDLIKGIADTAAPEGLTNWPQFAVPDLKNYTSPTRRVILIGDAAHAIPPTGGQGAAMAFEDAQTLAFVLARFARPTPPNRSAQSHTEILEKWQAHRQARVAEVHAFTTRGGDVRKSAPGLVVTYVKEWVLWGIFKWWGPTGGLRWLYEYKGEDVIGALAA